MQIGNKNNARSVAKMMDTNHGSCKSQERDKQCELECPETSMENIVLDRPSKGRQGSERQTGEELFSEDRDVHKLEAEYGL